MDLANTLPSVVLFLSLIVIVIAWSRDKKRAKEQHLQAIDQFTAEINRLLSVQQPDISQHIPELVRHINHAMEAVPGKVLRCIQGDLNHLKGTVAEHISYLQLNASYDRLLPFNSITDFIGIRFPRGTDPGALDFIDIKSGNARLSKEQSRLRRIIDGKHINFVTVKVITDQPNSPEEEQCAPTL